MDQKMCAQLREGMAFFSTTDHAAISMPGPSQEFPIWGRALGIGRNLKKMINSTVGQVRRWVFIMPWQKLCHLHPSVDVDNLSEDGSRSLGYFYLCLPNSLCLLQANFPSPWVIANPFQIIKPSVFSSFCHTWKTICPACRSYQTLLKFSQKTSFYFILLSF